jgi:hypothetical protein
LTGIGETRMFGAETASEVDSTMVPTAYLPARHYRLPDPMRGAERGTWTGDTGIETGWMLLAPCRVGGEAARARIIREAGERVRIIPGVEHGVGAEGQVEKRTSFAQASFVLSSSGHASLEESA